MNLEIKTEKELALLMFGMTLSNTPELDFWHEQTTDDHALFGDFQSICFIVNRDGRTWTDYNEPSSKVLSLALDGAYAEACRDAAQVDHLVGREVEDVEEEGVRPEREAVVPREGAVIVRPQHERARRRARARRGAQ